MKRSFLLFVLSSVLLFSGCSSLMHPKAEEFYTQAKGETGKQTAIAIADHDGSQRSTSQDRGG